MRKIREFVFFIETVIIQSRGLRMFRRNGSFSNLRNKGIHRMMELPKHNHYDALQSICDTTPAGT